MIVNIGPTVTIERHFTLSWFRLTIKSIQGCTAISDDEARQLLAYLKSELEPEANTHQCSDEFPCHRCTECDKEEAAGSSSRS
jgi:hypothetical protein